MGTRPRQRPVDTAPSLAAQLIPPAPPNHRLWWLVIGGGTGTVVLLAALLAVYLGLAAQNAPPEDGWQGYFAEEFRALRTRQRHFADEFHALGARLDRIERAVTPSTPKGETHGLESAPNP